MYQQAIGASSDRVNWARLTRHAVERMSARRLSAKEIQTVLDYGRVVYARGASIHAIGRKEIERFERDGIDLFGLEGIQVVCTSDGSILTAYRNRDFRGLRPRRRHRRAA